LPDYTDDIGNIGNIGTLGVISIVVEGVLLILAAASLLKRIGIPR
jgi:hypothetical protein